jgi:hypothetical protein
MQQLPALLHSPTPPQHISTGPSQSTAGIVVSVLYLPASDVSAFNYDSILARNGWQGGSSFNFDASPEDDAECGCQGLMMDMTGCVMRKRTSSSSSNNNSINKPSVSVVSSPWAMAEGARPVASRDIICITYTPHNTSSSSSSSTSSAEYGGWMGGRAEIRVNGGGSAFACCDDVPAGHVAGDSSDV